MSTKSLWILCFLLLLVTFSPPCRSLAAGPYRVKADATGVNNGTSWANAFTDLQFALVVAQSGEEIWVAAGTYKPTSGTDRNKSFVLVAGAGLYGGFAGTETTREQRNWKTHETILSGDIGVQGNASDNSYHVVVGGVGTVLDGFTVQDGNGQGGRAGGGMYNVSASPTVANCIFTGNKADWGGGIYNFNCTSLTVSNCFFSSNTTTFGEGGGLCSANSITLKVSNCDFSGNHSISYGGGIYNNQTSATLSNCTFNSNSTNAGGGGMSNNFTPIAMTNCVFSNNTANGHGGGIYHSNSSSLKVTNCTFSGNSSNTYGGGMFIDGLSPTITNTIMWADQAPNGAEISTGNGQSTFRNCDIQGSGGSGVQWNTALGTDGGGNIMADPRFVDAIHPAGTDGIWMTADDGLRLQADSLCINAGYPVGAPTTDILGNSRIGIPDIGAYEFSVVGTIPQIASLADGYIPDDQTYTGPTPVLMKGTLPTTWSMTQGPSGMVINKLTGVLTWPLPTMAGSPFTIKIRATNAFGQDETSFTLTVGKDPVIMPINDIMAPDNHAYTGPTPNLIAGTQPIVWSLAQGPAGMTITSSTGVVFWQTPTMTGSPHTIRVRATNPLGQAELIWNLTIGKVPIVTPINNIYIPDNQAYNGPTPVLTAGTAPITWSLIQGPSGMIINSAIGVVSWPTPTTIGSPFTIKIRATNAFGQADSSWILTVYHPGPPSTPIGGLEVTYHIKTPSVSPDGQPVQYTYVWTSDTGDRVTHGPTLATSDTLTEMNLVQDGETWTVTVTPQSGNNTGAVAVAKVKFVDVRSGVWVWSIYR